MKLDPDVLIHYIFCAVLVAAITVAAIYFGKPSLCWWYIAPTLLVLGE